MMSSADHNIPPAKPAAAAAKEENQNGGNNRKTAANSRAAQDQQQAVKCPRCDSPNTKFCYYNNYSLTQPRHFCKTCRRYWTKGGALRSVPIGGGCRKNNKKIIKSFSATTSPASEMMGGLKFFPGGGLSNFPAMDFQLGGGLSSFPRLINPSAAAAGVNNYSQFASFGDGSISLMGFNNNNNPLSSFGDGSLNVNSGPASSIEYLSSINQDLHWKLQQKRLAMLYAGEENNQKENSSNIIVSSSLDHQKYQLAQQKAQPALLFQNLQEVAAAASKPADEISGVNNNGNNPLIRKGNETATEWFFGNCYTPPAVTPTPTTSCSNGNGNGNCNGNDHNTTSNWNNNGVQVQAWNHDLHQYSTLP